jgi:AraC-like DNA-binding protein
MGVNPMKFVMAMRMERAQEYLRRCDFTITMAAHKAGFNDLSNFVRQFKKLTGMTPSCYKESAKS